MKFQAWIWLGFEAAPILQCQWTLCTNGDLMNAPLRLCLSQRGTTGLRFYTSGIILMISRFSSRRLCTENGLFFYLFLCLIGIGSILISVFSKFLCKNSLCRQRNFEKWVYELNQMLHFSVVCIFFRNKRFAFFRIFLFGVI